MYTFFFFFLHFSSERHRGSRSSKHVFDLSVNFVKVFITEHNILNSVDAGRSFVFTKLYIISALKINSSLKQCSVSQKGNYQRQIHTKKTTLQKGVLHVIGDPEHWFIYFKHELIVCLPLYILKQNHSDREFSK